jgi:hypothetical protein
MSSFTQVQLDRAVPGGLAWLLGSVMECRGRQELHEQRSPEVLEALRQMALIQSAESSNRIEGVTVDAPRLRPLVLAQRRRSSATAARSRGSTARTTASK